MFARINSIEEGIVVAIQGFFTNPFLDWFFPFYTDIHKTSWFLFSFTIPLILFWIYLEGKKRFWIIAGFLMTIAVTDTFCGQLIKKTFERVRPFEFSASVVALSPASGFSFVSNHAANSFAIATYLAHFYPKQSVIFWILAGLTAASRVYNGVHYPSDVIIGGIIGFIFSKLIIKYFIEKRMVNV